MAQPIRVGGGNAHIKLPSPEAGDAVAALAASITWDDAKRRTAAAVAKRALDIALAILFAFLLAPLLLVAALLIRVTSPGPIIFRQQRYGYRCAPFTIYKLRTMCMDAEGIEHGQRNGASRPLFHKPRCSQVLTPVGRVLRKYSIDEIPQLWNVLRGDMSMVGPRPLARHEVEQWPRTEMRRFGVPPGLTGSWQVGGRNLLHDKERMLLDLHYVDNWNLMLDLRVLARTPWAVISARGAW